MLAEKWLCVSLFYEILLRPGLATTTSGQDAIGVSARARSVAKRLMRHAHPSANLSAFEVSSAGYAQQLQPYSDLGWETSSGAARRQSLMKRLMRRKKRAADALVAEASSTGRTSLILPHSEVHDVSASAALAEEDLFEEAFMDDAREWFNATLKRKGRRGGAAHFPWFDRRRRIDCSFRFWTGWTACSASCGSGSKRRHRGMMPAMHGGRSCAGATSETSHCFAAHCPIDCRWGWWSGWSPCPATCGGGKAARSRQKVSEAAHGGRECDDPWLSQQDNVDMCNREPCPIDCRWLAWGTWTTCSISCGNGTKQRHRDREHSAAYGGRECEEKPVETVKCNPQACPIDCHVHVWTEWAPCDSDCGGGKHNRSRRVLIRDKHGGEPCPRLTEQRSCNSAPCPPIKDQARDAPAAGLLVLITSIVANSLSTNLGN